MGDANKGFVKWFSELSNKDISIAGGKGASLAEMYNNKFPVPPGFIVTAQAYDYFIEKSGLRNQIINLVNSIDVDDTKQLESTAKKIRGLIVDAPMSHEMRNDIAEAYQVLDVERERIKHKGMTDGALSILKNSHEPPFVAVRSSATMEDLADASFAGQQETFLNVKGADSLIESVKKCFASLFTARAIYYRKKKGFATEKGYLAVVVQRMIDSQKSGVMFSKNPLKNDGNIVIEAVFGLGEGIVSGMISPDHYVMNSKLDLVDHKISDKKIALTRSSSGKTEEVKLSHEISNREVLTGHELKILGQYGLKLEEHYGKPQDIEFAIDRDGVYIVQSRPITTKVHESNQEIEGNVLLSGLAASPGVASGIVKIVHSLDELSKVSKGSILVTKMTNPDMVVAMARASAIITDEGGATSHAAIISREMGIPAVVGTRNSTERLKDGQLVTVDGFTGRIFDGKTFEKKVEIKQIVPTKKTKIKTIVDLPDYAERAALSGVTGVGLIRLETLIATSGKHPVWFVKKNKLNEYVSTIHSGLKKIAKHFDEMWIRTSDIRSDEYRNLEGAPETIEMNPMLGDHGIRFSLKNEDLLEAEFMAIKELADEYSKKIFGVMFPQIISVDEVKSAKRIASKVKFPSNVKLGIMVETPAAVQIINDLCEEGINFVSFGTNDLTQYTLALDRNNEDVQNLYNELNPAILNSISYVIRRCKKYGVETSICGQAGSKPEMVKFLISEGIDSISVNADAAHAVSLLINEIENTKTKVHEKFNDVERTVKIKRISHGIDTPVHHAPSQGIGLQTIRPMLQASEHVEPAIAHNDVMKHIESWGVEEGDYNPGKGASSEIPALNDSMSLSSEDFASKKVEEEIIELSSEKMEVSEIPYEVQQDILFDAIVFGEVENNPAVRKMLEPQGQIESAE
ncbi:MAG: phosphoenolpyruvate synthase [Nanoarchaeota archaeon]